jgi:restriction endonuclease S subunit
LINSEPIRIQRQISGRGGIIVHIYSKNFKDMWFPTPPVDQQERIVEYLDRKTALIDSLIEKTGRKIELLKEKRTSLINEVVTKGLDPDVEMKDSGVDWIGEIPRHWGISRLKYFVLLITEKGSPQASDIRISPENVENGTGRCFNLLSDHFGEGMAFSRGDILFNKLRLYLKKILFCDFEGYSMGEMIVLRTTKGVSRFHYYTFFHQGLIDGLEVLSTGVKLPRVSPDDILNNKHPFPPVDEQERIVEYLDEQTAIIDSTITKEEKRIELLKEYRQSLISEVVTGKVKVA